MVRVLERKRGKGGGGNRRKGKEGVKSEQRGEGEGWETSLLQDTSNTFLEDRNIEGCNSPAVLERAVNSSTSILENVPSKGRNRERETDGQKSSHSFVLPILAAIHFPDTMQSRRHSVSERERAIERGGFFARSPSVCLSVCPSVCKSVCL